MAPGTRWAAMTRAAWGAALVAALAPLPAPAQQQTPAPAAAPLTLEEAVKSALTRGTPVRLARQRLASSRGAERAAAGAFDTQLNGFAGARRENTLAFDGTGAPAVNPSELTGVTYGAGVEKRFRSGVVVGPEISATRREVSPHVEERNNTASAALVVQVPLSRGLGAAVNAAPERAARSGTLAAGEELSHAAALSALDAVGAYWAYVAARERLDVQRQAEERSVRLVERTRVLVAAEERPAADLNQLLATQAFREASRIAAEQEVVAAREALGLVMGLPSEAVAALPEPATPFPAPSEAAALPDAALLAQAALERRADLRAALHQREAAGWQARAAADGLRPKVALEMRVGYTGAEPGSQWSGLFTPFYRSMSGWTASLQVDWQLSAGNAAARGVVEQRRAAQRETEVAADELARAIRSGVAVAAAALRNGRLELERGDEAVKLYQTVVEAEERKFQLGMSTIFDVIQAEDALISAMSSRIGARARYATALARLAFETGTLVSPDDAVADAEARP